MDQTLDLTGPLEITEQNFKTQMALNREGIFVLFKEEKSVIKRILSGSDSNLENGIRAALKQRPDAAHFSYQVSTHPHDLLPKVDQKYNP